VATRHSPDKEAITYKTSIEVLKLNASFLRKIKTHLRLKEVEVRNISMLPYTDYKTLQEYGNYKFRHP
jgi:hypothetical protein